MVASMKTYAGNVENLAGEIYTFPTNFDNFFFWFGRGQLSWHASESVGS